MASAPSLGPSWSSRLTCWLFRHEGALWVLLSMLCLASLWSLPRLKLVFGFKSVLKVDHPARQRLEVFDREFHLGDSLLIHFESARTFTAPVLRQLRDLSGQLEQLEGVRRAFSAVDLLRPAVRSDHLRLVPLLGAETLASEEATRRVLAAPPFSDRWHGYLYDRALSVYTMIVRPTVEYEDPHRMTGLLSRIEQLLQRFRERTGVAYHLNGLYYLNSEMIRSTFRDQGKLSAISMSVLLAAFWWLYGSFSVAAAAMLVLGVSILLSFGMMVVVGVPINGLSGNLPILTLVNGLEDVVFLLALFHAARPRMGRRRAAATALRDGLIPNLLTSLTTFGALVVTGYTDLALLEAFGYAICIGVAVEYVVIVVYFPLLLQRLPDAGSSCLYYRLERALAERWMGTWKRLVWSRGNLAFWGAVVVALAVYAAPQRLNSNWYRYFVAEHPVSRTLDFCNRRGFPITTIDCAVPCGLRLDEMLIRPALERDLEKLAKAIGGLPGVVRVDSYAELKGFIELELAGLVFQPGLEERWKQARREALYRQYLDVGAFDEFYSPSSRKLRLAVQTRLEDANSLLALGARIVETARRQRLECLDGARLTVSGTMAYWGEIMGAVATSFFTNLATSMLFVYLVLLAFTRRLLVSTIAMVPNILPLLAMFAAARAMGQELNETFCILNSLAVGNSVNDTIHYIVHVDRLVSRGRSLPDALREAFREVGCSMMISSALVALGFMSSLASESVTAILFGFYMTVGCAAAILFDLFLHPAMLLKLRRW
ncbi:MAG: MMPL family transporter [Candidatus Wallbacteria bacterium]|nr:MMPL family transporter [Candidatus Wallbacteria bacterium]